MPNIYIWNPQLPTSWEIDITKDKLIQSCEEFDKFEQEFKTNQSEGKEEKYDGVFILCELSWAYRKEKEHLSYFRGLEVAAQLRILDMRCPIVFLSFARKKDILERYNNHCLLSLPESFGISFQRLPVTLAQLKKDISKEKIDTLRLIDTKANYCSLAGRLSTISHKYQDQLAKINDDSKEPSKEVGNKEKLREIFIKFINEISEAASEYPFNKEACIDELEKILESNNYFEQLTILRQNLVETLVVKIGENDEFVFSKIDKDERDKGYKILFLEDERKNISSILEILENNNINYEVKQTTEDALDVLDKDANNSITLVCADYRLYENGNLQEKQGYTFIEEVAKRGRINELVILSGMSSEFIMNTFNNLGIRVNAYHKSYVNSNKREQEKFAHTLVKLARESYDAVLSLPKTVNWTKYHQHFYFAFRNDPSYEYYLQEVYNEAKRRIEAIEYNLTDIRFLKNPEGIEPLKGLGNWGEDGTKKGYKVKDYYNETNLTQWKKKLIGRLVAIYYLYFKGFSSHVVYGILYKGKVSKKHIVKPSDLNAPFNKRLSLDISGFPNNILIEEKYFFENVLGVFIQEDAFILQAQLVRLIENYIEYLDEDHQNFHSGFFDCIYNLSYIKSKLENISQREKFDNGLKEVVSIFYNETRNSIYPNLEDKKSLSCLPKEQRKKWERLYNDSSNLIISSNRDYTEIFIRIIEENIIENHKIIDSNKKMMWGWYKKYRKEIFKYAFE